MQKARTAANALRTLLAYPFCEYDACGVLDVARADAPPARNGRDYISRRERRANAQQETRPLSFVTTAQSTGATPARLQEKLGLGSLGAVRCHVHLRSVLWLSQVKD